MSYHERDVRPTDWVLTLADGTTKTVTIYDNRHLREEMARLGAKRAEPTEAI
ncbi:hypothetical protein HAP48_0042820 [Bradyrhizobium septentrionale]|uniref:Uncharacterized protein n=1 Tax=Bradyrhizobium septentrionale TaxID=1404411 RepID=A0A973W2N6_9BRAD|nr:hypothetical protein [Bradyrhizobium septentrionale]UGY15192.1 hypothetical protein HAP48_0042820 [Bradyrhizobium septentrionale]